MLFISGTSSAFGRSSVYNVSISQSRCLSFQEYSEHGIKTRLTYPFQSRNRDACHFRATDGNAHRWFHNLQFQSRNRDACHFMEQCKTLLMFPAYFSFNLAIEMLVISCRHAIRSGRSIRGSFNLAIERLFISCDCVAG